MFYIFTTLADLEDNQSDQEPRIVSCGWTPDCGLAKKSLPSFASYPNMSITVSLICLVETDLVILEAPFLASQVICAIQTPV